MIDQFKNFFDKFLGADNGTSDSGEYRLHLATAALLIEMTRVDEHIKPEEQAVLAAGIRNTFGLSEHETDELISLAEQEAHDATCYHAFTSLINKGFSREQKIRVVEMLWEIAYADQELDMYEEHLVRKLSELLYVRHNDFIAAKLRVRARLGMAD
jgi:uncharacterized tellurite resistance protein B-like protein